MGKQQSLIWLYFFLFLFGVGIDRITKWWALSSAHASYRSLFPGCNLVLAFNHGVAFGWCASSGYWHTFGLITLVSAVIILLVYITYTSYRAGITIIPEVCILAGAVSNLYDRFVWGAVVDFIDLYVGSWHWYTFNVADMLLVGGAVLMVIRTVRAKG